MSKIKQFINTQRRQSMSIRVIILLSFSAASFLIVSILGISISSYFTNRTTNLYIQNGEKISKQEVLNIENYLSTSQNTAMAIYYDFIKNIDLDSDSLDEKFDLLYAANSNQFISISLFSEYGELLYTSNHQTLKPNVDVTRQEWFLKALEHIENSHFSTSHVQNLFTSSAGNYPWVISLSMAVELTRQGNPLRGVLLIDMDENNLEQLLKDSNQEHTNQYAYLITQKGEIIYHPRNALIYASEYEENILAASEYQDGTHHEIFNDQHRIVIVNTISYTGWKLVNVIPSSTLQLNETATHNIILLILSVTLLIIIIINRYLANRISKPIIALNDAINNTEMLNIPENIYDHSSKEIQELGTTLHAYVNQISRLLDDVIQEEEEKRKSELDALQAQINPHFLYNTLDSIVWMIEGEKYQDAVNMITQLASFFRMSLNNGRSMITIGNELKQAKAYLAIQKVRYKNSFQEVFDIEDNIEDYMAMKLIIQPILENAIYHGIKEAEQDGEIRIHGYKKGNDIYIAISDNGYGMSDEEVQNILVASEKSTVVKHGSGVGLINVNQRLQLRFGKEYGLKVESELDVGTTVTIHIPAILATPQNMRLFEHEEVSHES